MGSLPGQRRIDRICLPFRPAPDNGEIFLGDALFLHQQTKPPGGSGIFRYQDEPAGLAIEAINNRNLSAVLDLEREKLFQFAPKGPHVTGFGGMNEKKGRFFNDHKVVGLGHGEEIAAVCARRLAGG
jgi:hypothetical protein